MKKHLEKILLIMLLIVACAACSGSDDNENDALQQKHDELMTEYLTPALLDSLNNLGVRIHKGVNPPNVVGYYSMIKKCVASNIENDGKLNKVMNNSRYSFFNQRGLNIDMVYHQIWNANSNELLATTSGDGLFISGYDEYFTIFFISTTETVGRDKDTEQLIVISGEVDAEADGTVKGIKQFQQAFLMRNNQGYTDHVENGEGRLFEEDNINKYTPAITKKEFENFTVLKNSAKSAQHQESASDITK